MKNKVYEMKMLFERRPSEWIPVYECAKIALQYNRVLNDLSKKHGMYIECKTRRIDGTTHSWKRYKPTADLFGSETFNQNSKVNLPNIW